jgi:hypothetical protein
MATVTSVMGKWMAMVRKRVMVMATREVGSKSNGDGKEEGDGEEDSDGKQQQPQPQQ